MYNKLIDRINGQELPQEEVEAFYDRLSIVSGLKLKPVEARVIKLRYNVQDDLTSYADIGVKLGLSKQRIQQIESEAIKTLRSESNLLFSKLSGEELRNKISNQAEQDRPDMPLSDLFIKNRTYQAFSRHNIRTAYEVLRYSSKALLRKKGIGVTILQDMYVALRNEGYDLHNKRYVINQNITRGEKTVQDFMYDLKTLLSEYNLNKKDLLSLIESLL